MTYSQMCDRLRACGIENFKLEAKILIEEICKEDFSESRDYVSKDLESALEKRCQRYPLQYIIGKWWFARCEFLLDESCLVPRPDTEVLVECAVKRLPGNACFADLCTGSGCIAISVLDLREDTLADAYELYPQALEMAKRNAVLNKVDARFSGILGNVLEPDLLGDKKYHAILSNPPYIRADVVPTLEKEVQHEPRAALDGGADGLDFYRAIVKNFTRNLLPNGEFLFEIGYDQGNDIERIAKDNGFECEIKKDLGGLDRVAILRRGD